MKRVSQRNYKTILKYLPFVLIGTTIIFSILSFNPVLETGGDNASYILLAKALITGKGYTRIFEPGNPPETMYPMGYPLLLAPLVGLFGYNFIIFKTYSLLFFLGSIWMIYLIFLRKYKLSFILIFVPLLLVCNPLILEMSSEILSEMPFLFFSLLSIYLLINYKTKINLLLLPLVLAFTFYIRAVGVALLISSLVYLLFKKDYRALAYVLIISVLLMLPMFMRSAKSTEDVNYISVLRIKDPYNPEAGSLNFSGFLSRIFTNIKDYGVRFIPGTVIPQIIYRPLYLLSIFITLIIFYSWIRQVRSLFGIYLFIYLGVLIVRPPVWNSMRFLVPVIPVLAYLFVIGVEDLFAKRLKFKNGVYFILGIIIFVNLIRGFTTLIPERLEIQRNYRNGNKMAGYTLDWVRYYDAADWIKRNTQEESVVICRKPSLFYLFGERKCLNYPPSYEHSKVLDVVLQADYVLVDNFYWTGTTQRYLIPALRSAWDRFKIVYTTPNPATYVFQVSKD